jgi:hypothetical protein
LDCFDVSRKSAIINVGHKTEFENANQRIIVENLALQLLDLIRASDYYLPAEQIPERLFSHALPADPLLLARGDAVFSYFNCAESA